MQKLNHSEFFENDRIINVLPRVPQEPFPEHSHDFHELVLVKSGCGIHICDGKATHVSKGSVLYLKDEDESHYFDQLDNLCLTNVLFMPSELHSKTLLDLLNESCSSQSGQFIVRNQIQCQAESLLEQISAENDRKDQYSRLMIETLLSQLAITFSRSRKLSKYDVKEDVDNLHSLINFINEHYQQEINWTELSGKFGIPLRTMNRKLQEYTGLTPNNYLGRVRLCQASYLLSHSQDAVTDIAFSCGFNDSNYFSSKFHQAFNVTPMQYRKRYKLS